MHPILFRLAGHPVEAAGTLYLLAAVLAGSFAVRLCRRQGWDPDDVVPGLLLTVAAAYLGARLHGAILAPGFPPNPLLELLRPGGLSFFGGLISGSLAVLGYLRWKRLPLGAVLDGLAPLGPVLYAMFRLGCWLNGDDYGPPTSLPWGMRFPAGSPPAPEPVHPTQLYEILLMLPVFLWLRAPRRAELPAGARIFALCLLMGAERFLAEIWRLGPRGAAGLSPSQWLALGLCAIGVLGWLEAARRSRRFVLTPTVPR